MTLTRRDRLIGLCFWLVFPLYGVGRALLDAPSSSALALTTGALLVFANGAAVCLIGALLADDLARGAPAVAAGYLVGRGLEALLLTLGAMAVVIAPTGSVLEGPARSALLTTYHFAMMALATSSVPVCLALLRGRLVPRPLAALGVLGYGVLFLGSAAELFGWPIGLLASVPGGLFELGLGGWLLVKGLARADVTRVDGWRAADESGSATLA